MSATPTFLMLTTSVADRAEADGLAHALVEAKLAACVQLVPIGSVYRWNGAIEAATEILLLAKIRSADLGTVEAVIRGRHSYDVPEIVALPIVAGSADYLGWIAASTAR